MNNSLCHLLLVVMSSTVLFIPISRAQQDLEYRENASPMMNPSEMEEVEAILEYNFFPNEDEEANIFSSQKISQQSSQPVTSSSSVPFQKNQDSVSDLRFMNISSASADDLTVPMNFSSGQEDYSQQEGQRRVRFSDSTTIHEIEVISKKASASDETRLSKYQKQYRLIKDGLKKQIETIAPEDPENISKVTQLYEEIYPNIKTLLEKTLSLLEKNPSLLQDQKKMGWLTHLVRTRIEIAFLRVPTSKNFIQQSEINISYIDYVAFIERYSPCFNKRSRSPENLTDYYKADLLFNKADLLFTILKDSFDNLNRYKEILKASSEKKLTLYKKVKQNHHWQQLGIARRKEWIAIENRNFIRDSKGEEESLLQQAQSELDKAECFYKICQKNHEVKHTSPISIETDSIDQNVANMLLQTAQSVAASADETTETIKQYILLNESYGRTSY